MPGVCILQIFKELAEIELAVENPLAYTEIKQCKFLLPIAMNSPIDVVACLSLKQDGTSWNLSADLKNDSTVFTILKAVLTTKR